MRSFVCGPRQSGRTKYLVEQAIATDGIIIVANERFKSDIIKHYDFPEERIFTVFQIKEGKHYGLDFGGVYVDDADLILSWLLETYRIDGIAFLYKQYMYSDSSLTESVGDRVHD